MKAASFALSLALLWQAADAPRPQPKDFRYLRTVTTAQGSDPQSARACAIVPGEVYERSPALADVRLYRDGMEVPYALTSSETATPGNDQARVLNAGVRGGHVVFDLAMPARAYSSVTLDLTGQDFLATAKVSGLKDANDGHGIDLGTFTLFDLTSQRLGRSTTLPLAEATFPILHIDLSLSGVAGKPAPVVTAEGAEIPPSREAQTLYTVVGETTTLTDHGRETVATFTLPAHVPVERVSFVMVPGDHTNFSRPVEIRAKALHAIDGQQVATETIPGNVARVRMSFGTREIKQESLSVAATIGANGDGPATVEVAIENGDDQPLKLAGVKLEMRQRQLCFDAPDASSAAELYYGAARLAAPVYDYARLFTPSDQARVALLGAEQPNTLFVEHVERKSLTERHPELLWLALLAMVSVLGVVAFRSAKKV